MTVDILGHGMRLYYQLCLCGFLGCNPEGSGAAVVQGSAYIPMCDS